MEFQTARCRGRPFVEEDFEHLCALMSDPAVVRHTGFRTPREAPYVRERLQVWMGATDVWCVEIPAHPEVGIAWFMRVSTPSGESSHGDALRRLDKALAPELMEGGIGRRFGRQGRRRSAAKPRLRGGVTEQEIGFMLPRAMQGRGIATEVAGYLVRTAERPLVARVDVANVASIRVLEKVGFSEVSCDGSTRVYRHPKASG